MAVTKFAQNGLVRLGYEMHGEGAPAIFILHGLLQGRVTMRPLMDALDDHGTVISMDLRGHGGSSAVHGLALQVDDLVRDAFTVLDAAEIESNVIMVGIELGAVIAAAMQALEPDRIRGSVLVNYPTHEMLDANTLSTIADRAYQGQAEQALNRWLDLSWGSGWQESVPRPRIAAARRSAEAIHPLLTALAKAEVEPLESLSLPGGTLFAEEANASAVVDAIQAIIDA